MACDITHSVEEQLKNDLVILLLRASCYEAQKVNVKYNAFLVFYLRGCDKEEVLPNEIACKEVVHLERRNMEHLFCKE